MFIEGDFITQVDDRPINSFANKKKVKEYIRKQLKRNKAVCFKGAHALQQQEQQSEEQSPVKPAADPALSHPAGQLCAFHTVSVVAKSGSDFGLELCCNQGHGGRNVVTRTMSGSGRGGVQATGALTIGNVLLSVDRNPCSGHEASIEYLATVPDGNRIDFAVSDEDPLQDMSRLRQFKDCKAALKALQQKSQQQGQQGRVEKEEGEEMGEEEEEMQALLARVTEDAAKQRRKLRSSTPALDDLALPPSDHDATWITAALDTSALDSLKLVKEALLEAGKEMAAPRTPRPRPTRLETQGSTHKHRSAHSVPPQTRRRSNRHRKHPPGMLLNPDN